MKATTLLGFDYGLRKIGVAVGQTVSRTANPLAVIPARDGVPDWETIRRLIDEWQPHRVLVGLPLNMDDTESDMSARARRFARRLEGRFGVTVELVDERLTSFAARSATGNRDAVIDDEAARLIVETWLNALPADS